MELGWNDRKNKERERNNLAEGPRSRTERNNWKKVRICPALPLGYRSFQIGCVPAEYDLFN